MQRTVALVGRTQLLLCGGQASLLLLQTTLESSKGTFLVSEGLGILGTLVCGVRHEYFVILLGILLSDLSFSHLIAQVLDEEVDHGNDAIALLGLLGESLKALRWSPIFLPQRDNAMKSS